MTMKRWILVAAVLGSGIVFLDSTVVNVALPRIGRDLHRTFLGVLEGQSYVYNAYLLTLSALLILAGAINDFYGRKRTFLIGLVGFGATSVLCGFAPSMELLVLFRVLQGAAGALLVPGSLALLTANFEGEEQGRAFGTWAGASGATTILGPVVGGLLVDTISWRAAFFINVPLVAVAAWATWKHVPESRDENATPDFDWVGAAIVALAVGGLAFGTIYGQQRAWRDPGGYIALAVGVASSIALPLWMRRAKHPLIPLELFRSRNFTVVNISTLLIYGSLYVTFYYLGLFQQGTLGYAAAAAGAAGIPGSLFLIFLSRRFGTLASRYGPRIFMTVGPVIMAVGVLWEAHAEQPEHVLAAALLLHRLFAGLDHLRPRHLHARGSADHGAHDVGAGAQRRAGVGNQQRDLASRPSACRRAHLRLPDRHVLLGARIASDRSGRHVRELSQGGEPAQHAGRSEPGCGRPRCVDVFVPARDGHWRGPSPGGRDRQRGRHPIPARTPARRGGEGARDRVMATMGPCPR